MKPRLLTRIVGGTYGLVVAAYLILPALAVIPIAFSSGEFLEFPPKGFSTRWVVAFFNDPQWLAALTRSIVIALLTAAIAVPIGTVAAYATVRGPRRVRVAVEPVVMLPLLVPVVISGFGLYLITLILRVHGGLFLVLLGHVGLSIPFVVTVVLAAMRTFDMKLLLAARVSGANATQAFLRVLVPVIAPAIGAAALIAIMTSLDEAVIALFLVGDTTPTLPVKMFSSITYALNPLVPVAATVLTLATIVLMLLSLFRATEPTTRPLGDHHMARNRIVTANQTIIPTTPHANGRRTDFSASAAALRLNNLTKRYGSVAAVRGVSLDVEPGEFLTLLGPSDPARPRCCRWSPVSSNPPRAPSDSVTATSPTWSRTSATSG